jgi:sensor histidine kinase YesM
LLLPFLENAFKHGTSMQIDQCWISLNLSVTDGSMNFKLVNSMAKSQTIENYETGGIGLANVKRRLELLYNDRYQLETLMQDEFYVVSLDIVLEGRSNHPHLHAPITEKAAI